MHTFKTHREALTQCVKLSNNVEYYIVNHLLFPSSWLNVALLASPVIMCACTTTCYFCALQDSSCVSFCVVKSKKLTIRDLDSSETSSVLSIGVWASGVNECTSDTESGAFPCA